MHIPNSNNPCLIKRGAHIGGVENAEAIALGVLDLEDIYAYFMTEVAPVRLRGMICRMIGLMGGISITTKRLRGADVLLRDLGHAQHLHHRALEGDEEIVMQPADRHTCPARDV